MDTIKWLLSLKNTDRFVAGLLIAVLTLGSVVVWQNKKITQLTQNWDTEKNAIITDKDSKIIDLYEKRIEEQRRNDRDINEVIRRMDSVIAKYTNTSVPK